MCPMGISLFDVTVQSVLKVLAEIAQDVQFNTQSYTLSIDLSSPHKKGVDQRGCPSYFMVAASTVPVQDSFPLPEGLQKDASDEKRRLQPPQGSPLDRDDLLEQLERELEEKLAREVAPIDLTGDDGAQQPEPAGDQAPLPEGGQQQKSGEGQASADQKSKEGESSNPPKGSNGPSKDDEDPWDSSTST